MKYLVERKFLKDLQPLSKDIKKSGEDFFMSIEKANDFREIHNIEKLTGYKEYYRYRVGNYRVGFSFREEKITFIRILHRSEIYKHFP
jgi:mRNA interferase RelE/StbE